MKSGVAAAVEALRLIRAHSLIERGSILLTAHDLHEAPWGLGQQLEHLIRAGYVGDAVLLPEPLCDRIPIAGRGSATWKVTYSRPGEPIHEVMRPEGEPSVIFAGAYLVAKLEDLSRRLSRERDTIAGASSVFIGQIHSGEIFNQFPKLCWLEGTRRWVPGGDRKAIEFEFRAVAAEVARSAGVEAEVDYQPIRDAFHLDPESRVLKAFQRACAAIRGAELPEGSKPFVDDGNTFWAIAGIPAITHGPKAGGQHTIHEWVDLDDLARVAALYAAAAAIYCRQSELSES
jgi:acetylornithine deacetylase/succinyl-diaminopimelate desuccinylase-like protein